MLNVLYHSECKKGFKKRRKKRGKKFLVTVSLLKLKQLLYNLITS